MPGFEIAAPPSAYAVVLKKDTYEYIVDIDAHGFTRTGKDGAEKILSLFMNEEHAGEYLEPQWRKGWTNTIDADQAFVALIDSGLLKIKGEADIAGTYGYGWIKSNRPVPMMDGTEVTVELEVPINDVAAGANRAIYFRFFLSADKVNTERPSLNDNTIFVEIHVTDNGLLMTVAKSIEDADTDLFTGSTYDDASIRSETAEKFTIWSLVFHEGVLGAAAPEDVRHMHVYLKQGVDRPTAEAATKLELTTSPYDISDVLFEVGYPSYQISTQNADYYDDGTEAVSTYFRVTYPDFTYRFLTTDGDDYLDGACEIWDGDPDAGGFQVHNENHVFVNDAYIQNGLIRLLIDDKPASALYGLKFYHWDGAAFTRPSVLYLRPRLDDGTYCNYPFLTSVELVSPEKIIIKVRNEDTSTADSDKYIDITIIIERGKYYLTFDLEDCYPQQAVEFYIDTDLRFAYIGDEVIGDDDLSITGNNTTLTDNFLLVFDDDQEALIVHLATNKKPDGTLKQFVNYDGERLQIRDIAYLDIPDTELYIGLIPFTLIANLFEEAEDATITAAVRLNLDGEGEDTVTEGQAVWANTTNCVIDVNDATDPQVGVKDVKITSSGAGAVRATLTPGAPLRIIKFDSLKWWWLKDAGSDMNLSIRITDPDGDWVETFLGISGSMVEQDRPLPHSSTDLQGWVETGTFDFSVPYANIALRGWTADGAGENVLIDGMHFYIGTTTTRGRGETLSGGVAVVLDAQNEYVEYTPEAGTNLPEGRYLAVYRAKDTEQVADDSETTLYDTDDAEYRNEQNGDIQDTLTAAFAYYIEVFDITAEDVSDTDVIRFRITKETATENTIFVDYFLLIFLGEGESGPMDLAHGALQAGSRKRRLPLR
jgi:hypothetical protein